ncbi:nuclear transport factor 2 family protein [Nocardioides flavescens]|uniref:SnoaL-like domain-containing protein n=1 Tax=Nocardioides flavescens TaxID=2691959 RepID=A0A6L7EYL8_9ACTN|nr:nuclear transport factor 2 family protein [Nocardioides flavescens]MXG89299.1 hypothetical protein [Nocardioides flavescens]
MSTDSLSAHDRAAAKSAVLDTVHRYAHLAKEAADFDAMVPLWTPDGTFTLPNGHAVPPTEIRTIVATGEPDFIRHHITTCVVDFPTPDVARADTYFIAYTDIAQPDHWGRWDDTLARQDDGRWLFTNKSVVIDGWAEVSFWADLMAKLAQ